MLVPEGTLASGQRAAAVRLGLLEPPDVHEQSGEGNQAIRRLGVGRLARLQRATAESLGLSIAPTGPGKYREVGQGVDRFRVAGAVRGVADRQHAPEQELGPGIVATILNEPAQALELLRHLRVLI